MEIYKEKLLPVLKKLTPVIGRKRRMPILNTLLWQETFNGVVLTTTNLRETVRVAVPGLLSNLGDMAIPARPLLKFVQSIRGRDAIIGLEREGLSLTLTAGEKTITLDCFPAADFPPMPEMVSTVCFNDYWLQESFAWVSWAAADNDVRSYLNGVRVEVASGGISLVASDGNRLAHGKFDAYTRGEHAAILPATAVKLLGTVFGKKDASLKASMGHLINGQSGTLFRFASGEVELFSLAIEAEFPEWEPLLPPADITKVSVDRDVLIKAIDTIAPSFSKNQPLILSVEGQRLTLAYRGRAVVINTLYTGETVDEIVAIRNPGDIKLSLASTAYNYYVDFGFSPDRRRFYLLSAIGSHVFHSEAVSVEARINLFEKLHYETVDTGDEE